MALIVIWNVRQPARVKLFVVGFWSHAMVGDHLCDSRWGSALAVDQILLGSSQFILVRQTLKIVISSGKLTSFSLSTEITLDSY
jgi:hypothetical protein